MITIRKALKICKKHAKRPLNRKMKNIKKGELASTFDLRIFPDWISFIMISFDIKL